LRVEAPTTSAELAELLARHEHVALYCTQPGCGPCHALWPTVEATLADRADVALARVDLTQAPEVRGQLLLFTVPALVLFRGGREVDRAARVIRRQWLEAAVARLEHRHGEMSPRRQDPSSQ